MRKGHPIGQLIREVRTAKGLTQMSLSELVGVSYQQIQKYEKSGDNISVVRLKQVADALGVPISVFLPSGVETVAESHEVYGKQTDEERLLLQAFRNVKDKRAKRAILDLVKAIAARS